jgi:hypothetical protein
VHAPPLRPRRAPAAPAPRSRRARFARPRFDFCCQSEKRGVAHPHPPLPPPQVDLTINLVERKTGGLGAGTGISAQARGEGALPGFVGNFTYSQVGAAGPRGGVGGGGSGVDVGGCHTLAPRSLCLHPLLPAPSSPLHPSTPPPLHPSTPPPLHPSTPPPLLTPPPLHPPPTHPSRPQRNLFGLNQKLSALVELGQADTLVRLQHMDPWLFGDQHRTSRTISVMNTRCGAGAPGASGVERGGAAARLISHGRQTHRLPLPGLAGPRAAPSTGAQRTTPRRRWRTPRPACRRARCSWGGSWQVSGPAPGTAHQQASAVPPRPCMPTRRWRQPAPRLIAGLRAPLPPHDRRGVAAAPRGGLVGVCRLQLAAQQVHGREG